MNSYDRVYLVTATVQRTVTAPSAANAQRLVEDGLNNARIYGTEDVPAEHRLFSTHVEGVEQTFKPGDRE